MKNSNSNKIKFDRNSAYTSSITEDGGIETRSSDVPNGNQTDSNTLNTTLHNQTYSSEGANLNTVRRNVYKQDSLFGGSFNSLQTLETVTLRKKEPLRANSKTLQFQRPAGIHHFEEAVVLTARESDKDFSNNFKNIQSDVGVRNSSNASVARPSAQNNTSVESERIPTFHESTRMSTFHASSFRIMQSDFMQNKIIQASSQVRARESRHNNDIKIHNEDKLFRTFSEYPEVNKEVIKEVLDSLEKFEKQEMIIFFGKTIYMEKASENPDRLKNVCISISNIFEKMKTNDEYKSMCLGIAMEDNSSCSDRTRFGYIKMLVTEKALPNNNEKFSVETAFEKALLLLKVDLINEFAKNKLDELTKKGHFDEDIETYLRFYDGLQDELGINGGRMLFGIHSGVTKDEIDECRKEIEKITVEDVLKKMLENDSVNTAFEKEFCSVLEASNDDLEKIQDNENMREDERERKILALVKELENKKFEILTIAYEEELNVTKEKSDITPENDSKRSSKQKPASKGYEI